jgi:hypothetical protein
MSRETRRNRSGREDRSRGRSSGGRRTSKFTYRKRNEESLEKRKHMTGSRDYFLDGTYPVFKPAENKENRLRILPPTWEDAEHYGFDVYVHYQIGPDKAAYLCLEKMQDKPCPICEERADAHNDGDEEYVKDLRPAHSLLVLIIDRDNKKEGPQIWTMPLTKIEGELLYKCQDRETGEYIYIDDPEKGYDFYFTRKGSGLGTEYKGVDIARKSSVLGSEEQMDGWLELISEKPIPEILVYYDYDHIEKVFAGKVERDKDAPEDGERGEKEEKGNKEEPEYTYDEIMDCRLRKLEKIAEEVGIPEDEIDEMDEDKLREEVCKELKLENTENNEEDGDDPDERLKNVRKKYSKKRD